MGGSAQQCRSGAGSLQLNRHPPPPAAVLGRRTARPAGGHAPRGSSEAGRRGSGQAARPRHASGEAQSAAPAQTPARSPPRPAGTPACRRRRRWRCTPARRPRSSARRAPPRRCGAPPGARGCGQRGVAAVSGCVGGLKGAGRSAGTTGWGRGGRPALQVPARPACAGGSSQMLNPTSQGERLPHAQRAAPSAQHPVGGPGVEDDGVLPCPLPTLPTSTQYSKRAQPLRTAHLAGGPVVEDDEVLRAHAQQLAAVDGLRRKRHAHRQRLLEVAVDLDCCVEDRESGAGAGEQLAMAATWRHPGRKAVQPEARWCQRQQRPPAGSLKPATPQLHLPGPTRPASQPSTRTGGGGLAHGVDVGVVAPHKLQGLAERLVAPGQRGVDHILAVAADLRAAVAVEGRWRGGGARPEAAWRPTCCDAPSSSCCSGATPAAAGLGTRPSTRSSRASRAGGAP